MSQNTDRASLAELLEQYGSTIESFDQLRSDSYEQQLAGQSLERLEHLYSELFRPGRSSEDIVNTVPPWPPGNRWAGEQPSRFLLDKIKNRFNTEGSLNTLSPISDFLDSARKKAALLPIGKQEETLDAIIGFIGQELIHSKMQGANILGNLAAVDRLQSQEVIKEKKSENQLRWRKYKDLVEEQKRKITDSIERAKSKGGITPETLAEIEQAAKLL